MKINTLEKLEILLFGLQAGKELDVSVECGTGKHLIFGDFDGLGFRIGNDLIIDVDGAEAKECYLVEGCMSIAKKDAKQWYQHINEFELSDKERGERDCVTGYPALVGQSVDYDNGYNEQYAKEQNQGSKEQ